MTDKSYPATGAEMSAVEASQPPRRSGFRTLVGYRTTVWRDRYAEMELVLESKHMNVQGNTHGGVYASILDAALGHATAWCAVPGNVRRAVTLSLTVGYLQGSKAGQTLTARGRVVGVEGRVVTCDAEVHDESGRLCALAQASFMYLPGSEKLEGVAFRRPAPASP